MDETRSTEDAAPGAVRTAGAEPDEPLYRTLVESIGGTALFLLDAAGRITVWNRGAQRITGHAAADCLGASLGLLLAPGEANAAALHAALETVRGGQRDVRTLACVRKDGGPFQASLSLEPVPGADGAVAGFAGALRDLGERLPAIETLQRTREMLAKLIDASPLASFAVVDDKVAVWNPAAERIYGVPAEQAVGSSRAGYLDATRIPPGTLAPRELRALIDERGIAHDIEIRRYRRDGKVADLSVSGALLKDEDDRTYGYLFTVDDVTERKSTEQQLRQAQKMEAVGRLTGGIAHDFNNLLGAIIGNLELAAQAATGDPGVQETIDDALAAALHGADLTHQLLAFARQQPLNPERIDIDRLVTDTARLLRRTLGETIEVTLDLAGDLDPALADPVQLQSSLVNLATNARDAMPDGGRLAISTRPAHLDEDYAAQHAEVTAGDYILIEVSDTGGGIPPEIIGRIFEPFFTTKERGKGTGLGLSMVFGFIKQSDGHITVYSEPGIGTTFRLYLRRAEAAETAPRPSRIEAREGRGETILAVEDNEAMRRVVVRQLTDLNYRVIPARDAAEALALLAREQPDLLFTDIVLPGGINGVELAERARRLDPAIRLLLTSGFSETTVKDSFTAEGTRPRLLTKPYRRTELAHALRDALES